MSLNNLDAIELRMALDMHTSVADQWIIEVASLQAELQRYKDALKIAEEALERLSNSATNSIYVAKTALAAIQAAKDGKSQ